MMFPSRTHIIPNALIGDTCTYLFLKNGLVKKIAEKKIKNHTRSNNYELYTSAIHSIPNISGVMDLKILKRLKPQMKYIRYSI
jgi:hypothetical protein